MTIAVLIAAVPPEISRPATTRPRAPKQGFQGMDTEPDSKEDDGDYNPDEAEEIGTEQEDHKQQSGNRQNSVDNQQIVPYRLPDPFEGYASEVRPFYNLHMTAGH